ncbi:MAG TPA: FecR domain-containing protein, partial [Dehalococcoidia bacterium]|nr:FecR domain-containing protein [Dehalococcoidia bacterium]
MTCYLGELDSGSKAELERHLDACARCRRAASEAETSIQSFSGALSAQRPEPELAGRVMAAVRAAAQDSAGEGPARRAVFLAPCVRWGAVAVALLVALAVGIALLRGEPGDDTGSPRPAPLVADGPEEPTPSDQELPPWPDAPSADEEAPPAGDAVAEWYEPPVPRAPWRAMPDVVAAPGALVGVDDAGRLVELGDGSTLELDAEARLTLGPVPDDGARPAYVTLDAGRMMADIEPGGGPFEVRTPHGTATVLGTRFLLSARGDRSVLLVIEGSVEFGNADDSVTVGQMQRCECRSDRPPADPTQVTRVRWEGRTWTGPDRVVQAPADPAPRETEAEPLPDDQQMPKTIGELIADLSHADAAVRVAGAGGLADPEGPVASAGEAELKPAVPPLIAMLREEDAGAQASAASALATVAEKVPDRDAMAPTVAPLIVVLDSPQAEARLNAALALKALAFSSGDEAMLTPAVIPLMAALY